MAHPSDAGTFHPFLPSPPDAWHPANEAAEAFLRVSIIGEDLSRLVNILSDVNDKYDKRLLFKYFVIELLSFMKRFEDLLAIANRAPVHDQTQPEQLSISPQEREATREASKQYHREKAKVEEELADIRNRIGAHRDATSWDEMSHLWERVHPSTVRPVYDAARAAFTCVSKLPLYEWFRTAGEDEFHFAMPFPYHLIE